MSLEDLLNSDSQLMITDLVVQKKDDTRISVFLNNSFAFGISYSTFEEFKLQKEMELQREKIQEILGFEEIAKARREAMTFIARKMRTEWEIVNRLRQKGFESSIIDTVMTDFRDKKYVDDADYAEMYIRDFLKFKKDGIYKLRQKLQEKRINSRLIETAIEKYVNRDDQVNKALNLARRKMNSLQSCENKKEKIYRYLVQKGFESEIVSQVLSDVFNNG